MPKFQMEKAVFKAQNISSFLYSLLQALLLAVQAYLSFSVIM